MRLLAKFRRACRAWFRPGEVEREVADELRFALDELTARQRARGLAPEAASRAARLELGRVDSLREDVQSRGLAHRLETLRRDLVYAWRSLARTPVFSGLVVLILAGGIGAATAMFSVVNALLLAPLPYRAADRLVFVWQDLTSAGYPRAPLAGPELQDLRHRASRFDGFGGIWANTVALTDGSEPEQLRVGLVTSNFFEVLGADAFLGRTFNRADESRDSAPAILLSHALWSRRYGASRELVGNRVLVNGRPATVVGVLPETFRLLLPADSAIPDDQQAWLLLGRTALEGPRQQQFLRVVGRMKPGVRLADAQQEIAAISHQVGREFTEYGRDGASFYAVGLQADATREMRPALLALLGAVSLLLTIGCVNVAGLLVTRAAARHHETAVRLAIGANRGRLFRQCLTEGLMLSSLGGALGVLMAQGLLALLLAARPSSLSRIDLTQLDLRVLLFAAVVSSIWGILFSLAPLSQVFRTNVSAVLHAGGRGTVGGGYRLRSAMVVAQVAISGVLLVTSILLAKGFYELQRVKAGFSDADLLTFKISLAGSRYRGPDGAAGFSRQLRERLRALPGVAGAGAISHLPFDTVPNWGTPYLPEHVADTTHAGLADARAVTPGYFEAIGAELVAGRWFSEADIGGSLPVAIVDSTLAARLWPEGTALGQRVLADPWTTGTPRVTVTIVGVVRHIRHREITRDLREQMYFPAPQSFRNPMAYVVKAPADLAAVAAAVRGVLSELDPTLPIYDVRPLSAYTSDARAVRAFTLVLALAFAGSALILATVGIYGITAYAAGMRRREFGVRFALGARSVQVAMLVIGNATALAAAGAALGCGGAVAAAHLIRSQLYAVSPADPIAFLGGAATVFMASLAASCLPAYRASRTSPLDSLRAD